MLSSGKENAPSRAELLAAYRAKKAAQAQESKKSKPVRRAARAAAPAASPPRFVSQAELLRDFQSKTPTRFHSQPVDAAHSAARAAASAVSAPGTPSANLRAKLAAARQAPRESRESREKQQKQQKQQKQEKPKHKPSADVRSVRDRNLSISLQHSVSEAMCLCELGSFEAARRLLREFAEEFPSASGKTTYWLARARVEERSGASPQAALEVLDAAQLSVKGDAERALLLAGRQDFEARMPSPPPVPSPVVAPAPSASPPPSSPLAQGTASTEETAKRLSFEEEVDAPATVEEEATEEEAVVLTKGRVSDLRARFETISQGQEKEQEKGQAQSADREKEAVCAAAAQQRASHIASQSSATAEEVAKQAALQRCAGLGAVALPGLSAAALGNLKAGIMKAHSPAPASPITSPSLSQYFKPQEEEVGEETLPEPQEGENAEVGFAFDFGDEMAPESEPEEEEEDVAEEDFKTTKLLGSPPKPLPVAPVEQQRREEEEEEEEAVAAAHFKTTKLLGSPSKAMPRRVVAHVEQQIEEMPAQPPALPNVSSVDEILSAAFANAASLKGNLGLGALAEDETPPTPTSVVEYAKIRPPKRLAAELGVDSVLSPVRHSTRLSRTHTFSYNKTQMLKDNDFAFAPNVALEGANLDVNPDVALPPVPLHPRVIEANAAKRARAGTPIGPKRNATGLGLGIGEQVASMDLSPTPGLASTPVRALRRSSRLTPQKQ